MYDGYLGLIRQTKIITTPSLSMRLMMTYLLMRVFYLNELLHAIEGHVIAQAQMDLVRQSIIKETSYDCQGLNLCQCRWSTVSKKFMEGQKLGQIEKKIKELGM